MNKEIRNYSRRVQEMSDMDREITFENLDYKIRLYREDLAKNKQLKEKIEYKIAWLNDKIHDLTDKKEVVRRLKQ